MTVADSDNNRVQQFQFAAGERVRAAARRSQNPPDPILYNQPDPVPPEVTVKATRSSGPVRDPPVPAAGELRPALQGRGERGSSSRARARSARR